MKSLFLTSVLFLSTSLYAETCAEKISVIETKIEYARKHNNRNQFKGLEKALAETKSNCTDEKLKEAKEKKIQEKEQDVQKAREELNEAKRKMKSDEKIKSKQDKLDRKMKGLEDFE